MKLTPGEVAIGRVGNVEDPAAIKFHRVHKIRCRNVQPIQGCEIRQIAWLEKVKTFYYSGLREHPVQGVLHDDQSHCERLLDLCFNLVELTNGVAKLQPIFTFASAGAKNDGFLSLF